MKSQRTLIQFGNFITLKFYVVSETERLLSISMHRWGMCPEFRLRIALGGWFFDIFSQHKSPEYVHVTNSSFAAKDPSLNPFEMKCVPYVSEARNGRLTGGGDCHEHGGRVRPRRPPFYTSVTPLLNLYILWNIYKKKFDPKRPCAMCAGV